MLELYQAYADWTDIMDLVEQLVSYLAEELTGSTTVTYQGREIDLAAPWRRATMTSLIEEQIGRAVDLDTPIDELRALCDQHDVEWKASYGAGKLLLELYEKTAESAQWQPVFVTEYPIEVSPLARPHRELPGMTERFECIVAGRELCNAFSELLDPDDQRARFEDQVRERDDGDEEAMAVDEDYLRALEYGLPPTGGLGIGIDRLVMLLTDSATIRDVVLFPTLRPEQDLAPATMEDDDGPEGS
jgi:lysyl-tRNA synthetase class 2